MTRLAFFESDRLMIGGHRGAAGSAPENTLASIEKAFADGAHFIETDLRQSLDGEILIFHDETLDRTTNGKGAVRSYRLKELKGLDAGYRFSPDGGKSFPYRGQRIAIPTLEEFFGRFPAAKATLDVKEREESFVHQLVACIKRARKEDHVLLSAEDDAVMGEIRRQIRGQNANIATGFSYREAEAFMQWLWRGGKMTFVHQGHVLQLPQMYNAIRLITSETVGAARDLGIELHAWTVNDPSQMDELIRMGVGGIVTDYPGRLKNVAEKNERNGQRTDARAPGVKGMNGSQ